MFDLICEHKYMIIFMLLIVVFTIFTKIYLFTSKEEENDERRKILSVVHNGITIINIILPFLTSNQYLLQFHLALVMLTLVHWQSTNDKCIYTKFMNQMDNNESKGYLWSKAKKMGLEIPVEYFKMMEYLVLMGLIIVQELLAIRWGHGQQLRPRRMNHHLTQSPDLRSNLET